VQPAFGAGETKALLPVFRGCVERVSIILSLLCLGDVPSISQVTSKWKDILTGTSEPEEIIDVSSWLTRAALDAIGEGGGIYRDVIQSTQSGYLAGYDANFGALDNAESEFVRTYHNLGTSIPHSFPHSRLTVFIKFPSDRRLRCSIQTENLHPRHVPVPPSLDAGLDV